MHFSRQRQPLLTCVDRSRFLMMERLPDRPSETTASTLKELFSALPKRLRKTMTVDNGGESQHQKLPVKTYFCDPHSPWQRGSIENANGVLRRYLPRKVKSITSMKGTLKTLQDLQYNTPKMPRLSHAAEALAKSMSVAIEIESSKIYCALRVTAWPVRADS